MKPSGLLPGAFALPGLAAVVGRELAAVGLNLGIDGLDWAFRINRLWIESFAKDRFPDCYAQLDGGDIRIMTAFLEPECASNTFSLLGGAGAFGHTSEFFFGWPGVSSWLRNAVAWTDDSFGPLATRDNTFVDAQPGAYKGDERWFFLNGIATSRALAELNAKALSQALKRNFITIHNPTQGLAHDLVESALQKFTNLNTEPVARAFVEITKALHEKTVRRVAVVAHSQGTIIAGDVLDLIYCSLDKKYFDRTNMNKEDFESFLEVSHGTLSSNRIVEASESLAGKEDLVMEKLELYMFANAASRMCYIDANRHKPHMESFANERDIVTRLGCLARDEFHREDLIRIDGPVFARRRYGHLLNAHYLPGFLEGEYSPLTACDEDCIGSSIHVNVRGNPCDKNPRRTPGPQESKLMALISARLS